jgi:hypothetical protein
MPALRPSLLLTLALSAGSLSVSAWAQTATTSVASPVPTSAAAKPAFAQASTWHYRVSTAYFAGSLTRAQMQFQPTATQGYKASLAVSIVGQNLLHMQTVGKRQGAGQGAYLLPSSFTERVMGGSKEVRQEKNQAYYPAQNLRFALPDEPTDSVSIHYQLQQWLASGALPAKAGAYRDVWLMRPEGIFHWRYAVQGMETLEVDGLGKIPALHIVPQPLGKGTAKSELWFAPSLGWAPVRIKMQLLDKTWVEMNWQAQGK